MSKHDDWQCFSENPITKVRINTTARTRLLVYWCKNKQRCHLMVSHRVPLKFKEIKYDTNITDFAFFVLWLMSYVFSVCPQTISFCILYMYRLIHPFNYKSVIEKKLSLFHFILESSPLCNTCYSLLGTQLYNIRQNYWIITTQFSCKDIKLIYSLKKMEKDLLWRTGRTNMSDWSLITRHQKSFLPHWATELNQQDYNHFSYWACSKESASMKHSRSFYCSFLVKKEGNKGHF